ncbi:hypothetical protein MKW92_039467, partial [Papaver armeniacum]
VTEGQGPNECGNEPTHQKPNPLYNQFEQIHGPNIDADGNGDLFPDADGNTLLMVDVDTMFVGMQFMDKDDFKKHLRGYAIKKRFHYKLKPNDNDRIKFVCRFNKSQDCKFFIWASVTRGEPTFSVRRFNLKHTCSTQLKTRNRAANAEFVAEYLYDKLKRGDAMLLPYALKDQFFTTHNTNVPYHVAWGARTMTLERLMGAMMNLIS